MLAHGFAMFNFQISHDSIHEIVSTAQTYTWKIQLGRFLKPVYDTLFGKFPTIPLGNGFIALIWLAFAGYLVADMLKLQKKRHIAIVCGILTTNLTVIALSATYTEDYGSNMLAVLFACFGCWLWNRGFNQVNSLKRTQKCLLFSAIAGCICASLALYQVYISCFITLVLILSILDLLDGKKCGDVWKADFIAAGAAVLGGILYYAIFKLVCLITRISPVTGTYNSLSNLWTNQENILLRIYNTLKQVIRYFLRMPGGAYSDYVPMALSVLLILTGGITFLVLLIRGRQNKISLGSLLTSLIFVAALPFAANVSRLLSTYVHMLMLYAVALIYLLVMMLALKCTQATHKTHVEKLAMLLLCLTIFVNIQTANVAYIKKNTQQSATLSVMTRVIDKIEATEDYEAGVTPVTFIGTPKAYLEEFEPFSSLSGVTGLGADSDITYYNSYKNYFAAILRVDVNLVEEADIYTVVDAEQVEQMPTFPSQGSVQNLDGVVVVKFE